MRSRSNLRYETQRDACRLWRLTIRSRHPFNCRFDQTDFINRIDIDRMDARAYRIVQLAGALARAVEDNLIRLEPDAQRLEEFTATVDLDVDARLQNSLQHSQIRVCFRRI